jgi:lysophospholipid acyltransferase (LPLAT)-like uncharacterized protein
MSKRFKYVVLLTFLPLLASAVIRLLNLSYRISHVNREPVDRLQQQGKPFIVCFWHGRIFSAMPFAFQKTQFKVLISRHGDGEFIARVVKHFNIGAVRGSHRKASVSSVREIITELKKGVTIGITPDGPKGPRHVFKEGIIEIARMTGKPIVLLTYSGSGRKVFSSWDKFLLAWPFSRVVFLWGNPLYVPKEASREQIEKIRQEVEGELIALTEKADILACGR